MLYDGTCDYSHIFFCCPRKKQKQKQNKRNIKSRKINKRKKKKILYFFA